MPHYPKITGEKCYLAPPDPAYADLFTAWLNDPQVAIHLNAFHRVFTVEYERNWLEKYAARPENEYHFAIVDGETEQPIGVCGLTLLDTANRTAQFGIFIGDRYFWRRGYGYEATMLLLDFAFHVINLNSVWLSVYEYNGNAISLYEKCGFQKTGRRREARILGDKKFDSILMDILASEFKSPVMDRFISELTR